LTRLCITYSLHVQNTIDLQAEYDASGDYFQARNAYYATKGWFTCDSLCQRNKARMDRAEAILNDIRAEGAARMSDAKRTAGIFSGKQCGHSGGR
jgi:hypothetical protein